MCSPAGSPRTLFASQVFPQPHFAAPGPPRHRASARPAGGEAVAGAVPAELALRRPGRWDPAALQGAEPCWEMVPAAGVGPAWHRALQPLAHGSHPTVPHSSSPHASSAQPGLNKPNPAPLQVGRQAQLPCQPREITALGWREAELWQDHGRAQCGPQGPPAEQELLEAPRPVTKKVTSPGMRRGMSPKACSCHLSLSLSQSRAETKMSQEIKPGVTNTRWQ